MKTFNTSALILAGLAFANSNDGEGNDLGIATGTAIDTGTDGLSETPASAIGDSTTPATTAKSVAAGTPKAPKAPKAPTKMDKAYELVVDNFKNVAAGTAVPRASMIRLLEKEIGISQQHASTYYHNATKRYAEYLTTQGQELPALPRAQSGKPKAVKAADVAATGPAATAQ